MAIGTPVDRGNAGGTTTATTGSFTPSANDILICKVAGRRNTSVPAQPTISDSLGGSWTEIIDVQYDPGANPRMRSRVFYQQIGGSPASMTVTGGVSDGTATSVDVISVSGASTDFSNVASGTNSAGDPSATISSPGANSAVFGFCFCNATNLITQVAGFTELYDRTHNAVVQSEFAYDLSSPASTLSWTSTNTNSIGIVFEVKEAGAAAAVLAADGGSYAVSGTAASLEVGKVVSAAGGSYAITGAATSLEFGRLISANGGSYSITGASAALLTAHIVSAGNASYSINGAAANLIKSTPLTANGGSYAITGAAANFLFSQRVAADSAAYSISGAATSLLVGHKIAANNAAYSISGTAALLERGLAVLANGGNYAISGADATFLLKQVVAANGGAYSISGGEVGLVYDDGSGPNAVAWQELIRRRRTS